MSTCCLASKQRSLALEGQPQLHTDSKQNKGEGGQVHGKKPHCLASSKISEYP